MLYFSACSIKYFSVSLFQLFKMMEMRDFPPSPEESGSKENEEEENCARSNSQSSSGNSEESWTLLDEEDGHLVTPSHIDQVETLESTKGVFTGELRLRM